MRSTITRCLLLQLLYSVVVHGDLPTFAIANFPRRLELSEQQPLSLECKTSNADQVRWLKDGRQHDVQGSLLFVQAVSRADAGEYRCRAENDDGIVVSPSVEVIVQYLDDFDPLDRSVQYRVGASEGGSFLLRRPKLLASDEKQMEFTWYRGDILVQPDTNHFVTTNGDLVVTSASPKDFGQYKVIASSFIGEAISKDYIVSNDPKAKSGTDFAILGSADKESVVISSTDQSGKSRFDCAPSQRADSIRWFLDGKTVARKPGFESSSNDRRLTVSNTVLQQLRTGKHSLLCKASASSGILFVQHEIELNIIKPPLIVNMRGLIQKPMGSSLFLPCGSSAELPNSVKWFKDGNEVSSVNGILTINSLTSSDFGSYQCEIRNAAGTDIENVVLQEGPDISEGGSQLFPFLSRDEENRSKVNSALPRNVAAVSVESAPSFDVEPTSSSARVGALSFLLECHASGTPTPTIVWKFEDDVIEPSAKYEFAEEGLVIHNLAKTDSGRYTCLARNAFGTESASATISVSGNNLIDRGPTNHSVLIGSPLQLPCDISPEFKGSAEVIWSFEGMDIPKNGNPDLRLTLNKKGGLDIAAVGPESMGEYTCTARVGEQEESVSMWLEIIEKPSMPTIVMAHLVNDSVPAKIRITWKEGFDGNSPIIRYMIQMRTLGPTDLYSDWESVGETDPAENCCSYLLDNLRPSVTAQFRVIAANKLGMGKPSLPTGNVTMPQQPPAAAPKNVAASARSSTSIMVQWQKPQDEQFSGDILGYSIRYRLAGYATQDWHQKNVTSGDARNAIIDQLITWRDYEIQIAAYNERGLGVYSKSIEVTTNEGVPTQAPRNVQVKVLNSTAVEVSFDTPNPQLIPGVNLGYKIQFWKGPVASEKLHKQVNVDPLSQRLRTTVEGLEKFGHYNMTVLCYTKPGDGPRSRAVHVVTAQDIPGVVASLTVQEVMFDGAVISWEQPVEPNGVITRYIIRYWADASPESKTRVEYEGFQRNATISGLQSITKYGLDIQASTIIGDGPREETKFESGRPPVLPDRATMLSVTDIQARSVSLQFIPGHDGYTAIRQWIVEARVEDSGVFHAVFNTSAPKARSLTVTNLRPYTRYQLRLIAENVKGRGAPSEPTRIFETKQTNPESPVNPLFAEPVSATSISLSWTPLLATQWNGQPKGYLVVFRIQGEESWNEMRTSSLRASDFILHDLAPYTNYEVDLFAENMFGKSTSAGMAVARTYESAPSGTPSNIHGMAEGIRSMSVKWDPVADNVANGEIMGYIVRAVPETEWLQVDETKEIDIPDPDQLTAKLTGLRAFTGYSVHVAAYTIVGRGPEGKSRDVIRTDEDIPGPPSSVSFSLVSEDEVRLKWLPPEFPNGKIKGYTVSYWVASDTSSSQPAMKAPLSSSLGGFTATNLKPNHKYVFTVAAETSVGVGPEAQVQVATTSVRVPIRNPPVVVRDQRLKYTPNEIAIRWDDASAETDDEAPVRSIQVEYQKANDDNWNTYDRPISGDKGGINVNGLSPNSAYKFRIRYVGDFAQSIWSTESEWMRTLPASPSEAPSSVLSTPYDSNSLQVQWSTPRKASWNSDSIGYHISYREYPSNETWQTEVVPPKTSHEDHETFVVRNLNSFRHYIVRMSTVNGEGESSYSTPAFVFVGYSIPKRPVTNLVAEPQSSSSISVRWDPWGESEQDVISGFKVRFAPVVSVLSDVSREEEVMAVENNSCLITDLRKFTEYQISVSPYNRAGEGEVAQVRLRTLEDVPGAVANLRFADVLLDSVKVMWDPPPHPNGIVTNYTVNYRTFKMLRDFKTEMQSRTSQVFFPAVNLEEGAVYVFTVWAETAAGRGTEATANISIGPMKDIAPPSRLLAIPGPSTVTLSWRDPARNDIVGHLIQAKRVANESLPDLPNVRRLRRTLGYRPAHILGQWTTLKTIEGTGQKHEISYRELEPSSSYVFRVFARTERGVGLPSDESDQLVVPASIPEDPFYTKWWFVVMVAMSTVIVIILVACFLCYTGSQAKLKRKRNSTDSLQLADGNFVTFQMKGNQRMNRSRNDLLMRPGTTQSWLSDRDPPAYGSVQAIDRGDGSASVVNMYGHLATDVIPMSSQNVNSRLSALVGRDVSTNGTAYIASGPLRRGSSEEQQSEYGHHSQYSAVRPPSENPYSSHGDYQADSFDEEEESEDGDVPPAMPISSIADHYSNADHYQDTWKRVRDSDAKRAPLPPSGNPPSGPHSIVAESPGGSSESTWPVQSGPQLVNGFSSFV